MRKAKKSKVVKNTKSDVEEMAWNALRKYFIGRGNELEAKIAIGVVTTVARMNHAAYKSRQLDIIEKRLQIEAPRA